MRKNKIFKADKLAIDVMEYAFIEWLIRRGVFTAFRANCVRNSTTQETFRDWLREHIRNVYRWSSFGPESLISSAFLFDSTPEGYEFWVKHSDAWQRFYNEL